MGEKRKVRVKGNFMKSTIDVKAILISMDFPIIRVFSFVNLSVSFWKLKQILHIFLQSLLYFDIKYIVIITLLIRTFKTLLMLQTKFFHFVLVFVYL
jgi:hypothetical protein